MNCVNTQTNKFSTLFIPALFFLFLSCSGCYGQLSAGYINGFSEETSKHGGTLTFNTGTMVENLGYGSNASVKFTRNHQELSLGAELFGITNRFSDLALFTRVGAQFLGVAWFDDDSWFTFGPFVEAGIVFFGEENYGPSISVGVDYDAFTAKQSGKWYFSVMVGWGFFTIENKKEKHNNDDY